MAVGMYAGARLAVVPEIADDGVTTIYRLQVGGGGGGGGGGDASAANQTTEIARLTSIRDATGAAGDTAYASADGSASGTIVAILKGAYVRIVTLATTVVNGAQLVRRAQSIPTHTTATLTANTALTAIAAGAAVNGARILNWTASPVYVVPGTTGTPASGAPSDFIPAAASGVPGQYEPPYIPTTGMQAVGASAGNLTVEVW